MATRLHIGAHLPNASLPWYAKKFDLREVVVGDPGSPSLATLRRWRRSVPPSFEFCVVAGGHLARVKPGPELERDLDAAVAAIDALHARCFLLPTPSDVTPSMLARERIGKVLGRLPRDATRVVWEPRGLWEVDDAAAAAHRWGVVLAVDAARDPVPAGPVAYVRLRALGETRGFGASALERVLLSVGARRDVYVVLETHAAVRESRTLRQLAEEGPVEPRSLGRLVRPRGIHVRDDEQE